LNQNEFKPKGKNFKKYPKKNYNDEGNYNSHKLQGSNKFDPMLEGNNPYYQQQPQQSGFRPDMMSPQDMQNMQYYMYQQQQWMTNPSTPNLTSGTKSMSLDENADPEQKIMDTLEYYFSIENLNKDYYFRKQLDENGYIDSDIIMTFNTMKKYSVTKEKIKEILKKFDGIIEMNTKDDSLLLRNKNWETVKDKLYDLETVKEIHSSKKTKPQVQNNNFVSMQNNYYYGYNPQQMGQYQYQGGFPMNQMGMNMMNYQMYNQGMNNNPSNSNY